MVNQLKEYIKQINLIKFLNINMKYKEYILFFLFIICFSIYFTIIVNKLDATNQKLDKLLQEQIMTNYLFQK
jgi:hypothetical protein